MTMTYTGNISEEYDEYYLEVTEGTKVQKYRLERAAGFQGTFFAVSIGDGANVTGDVEDGVLYVTEPIDFSNLRENLEQQTQRLEWMDEEKAKRDAEERYYYD